MQARKQHLKYRRVHIVCLSLACSSVCCSVDSAEAVIVDSVSGLRISGGKADALHNMLVPVDFPAAQDLAVMYPLRIQGGIRGDSPTIDGRTPLPQQWIEAITRVYVATIVEDVIQRETQFVVPNTSGASCHRLNETRFDFHMLSHLEDLDTAIASRVVNDVRHEKQWLRNAFG